MTVFHSGMFGSCDLLNRVDELAPVAPLRGEDLAPFDGQAVEAPPALAGFLDPPPGDPAALLEAVEQRIERRHLELEAAARALLDQLADFIAVPRPRLDQRQDQQLGAAFLQLPVEHPRDMLHSDILYRGTRAPASRLDGGGAPAVRGRAGGGAGGRGARRSRWLRGRSCRRIPRRGRGRWPGRGR